MDAIIANWPIIVLALAILVVAIVGMYKFSNLPPEEQLENVREWLLGAVTEAEIALGGGTGALKLRRVYDLFVARFPWVAQMLSFQDFSDLVDEALEQMRDLLKTNKSVKDLVERKE